MKTLLLAMSLLTFLGLKSAQALPIGAPAPVLDAVNQDGQKLNLGDYYRKGFQPLPVTSDSSPPAPSYGEVTSQLEPTRMRYLFGDAMFFARWLWSLTRLVRR